MASVTGSQLKFAIDEESFCPSSVFKNCKGNSSNSCIDTVSYILEAFSVLEMVIYASVPTYIFGSQN